MTEQQIDAELRRYEPRRFGNLHFWSRSRGRRFCRDIADVSPSVYRKLRPKIATWGAAYYPTREAAFADLRRAIALSNTQTT